VDLLEIGGTGRWLGIPYGRYWI